MPSQDVDEGWLTRTTRPQDVSHFTALQPDSATIETENLRSPIGVVPPRPPRTVGLINRFFGPRRRAPELPTIVPRNFLVEPSGKCMKLEDNVGREGDIFILGRGLWQGSVPVALKKLRYPVYDEAVSSKYRNFDGVCRLTWSVIALPTPYP